MNSDYASLVNRSIKTIFQLSKQLIGIKNMFGEQSNNPDNQTRSSTKENHTELSPVKRPCILDFVNTQKGHRQEYHHRDYLHERFRDNSMPMKPHEQSHHTPKKQYSCTRRQQMQSLQREFQKVGVIGSGGFGSVYLVKKKAGASTESSGHTRSSFAMKVIPKKELHESGSVSSLILEKKIQTELKNDFIVSLKYSFQDKKSCFMVMEYAPGGDAYSFVHNPKHPEKVQMFKQLGEAGPRFIMGCVVLALQQLHSRNIMYRDLKLQNVLVFEDGYAKITDFGLAQHNHQNQYCTTLAGTRVYLAPEAIEDQKYTKLVDLWALGVFLHQMILMYPPYDAMYIAPRRFKKLCVKDQKQRKWKEGKISNQAKDLICKLLRVQPHLRLGAKGFFQIKAHPFFSDFDWKALESRTMASPLKSIIDIMNMKSAPSLNKLASNSALQEGQYDHIPGLDYIQGDDHCTAQDHDHD